MRSILLILIITTFSCRTISDRKSVVSLDSVLSEYPGDFISVKSPVFFTFSDSIIIQSDNIEYQVSPKIEGELRNVSGNTYGFFPAEMFNYGTSYELILRVPEIEGKLNIPFATRKLEISVSPDNHVVYSPQEASVSGVIRTSDWVQNEDIESLINNQNITWVHSNNGRTHTFKINQIERQSTNYKFTLEWKNEELNTSGSQSFMIKPMGDFSYVDSEVSRPNRSVTIYFSDLLDQSQRLEGMISIPGATINNYRIDGSKATIYLHEVFSEEKELIVAKGIKSHKKENLSKDVSLNVRFDPVKPEVRLVGGGVITPFQENVFFPFEAIGLHAVDVEIFKIFENNVLQYLQNNRLSDRPYYLEQVGRIIHQEKVEVLQADDPQIDNWVRHTLDLKRFTEMDPGAIYVVRVGFRRDYSNYPCEEGVSDGPLVVDIDNPISIMRWNYQYDGYRYRQESDPCYPVYYNENRFIQRNILASNLGIIAKRGDDNRLSVHIKDLNSLNPVGNAEVSIYDFQKQLLISSTTDASGHLTLEVDHEPSFVVVAHENEFGYLNIRDQYANSLSDFDIGGVKKKNGIDAFIYGERGVWRPGDTIFLSVMTDDENNALPEDHPVTLTVKDARGKQVFTKTTTQSSGGIYCYKVPTQDDDMTGLWYARVDVGNQSFNKALRVETIKPNRLKIELDLPEKLMIANSWNIPMSVSWLHGSPGSGLNASVETSFRSVSTDFPNYRSYTFSDPARQIVATSQNIFKGTLDNAGKTTLKVSKGKDFLPPGKVNMRIKSKVYEPSGEYSEDNINVEADPYTHYVGIKSPESRWGFQYLPRDGDQPLSIISVDHRGNPISGRKISIGLYEAEWQWWYSRSSSNIYKYDASNHLGAVNRVTLETDSKGQISWRPESLDHYRYLVRACDEESGHCTGMLLYTSYYSDQTNEGGAKILSLTSEKNTYEVGEEMKIQIPSNESSEIYISIEGGNGIHKELWVKGKVQSTEITIPVESTMAPNVYVHAMLLQKGESTTSDLPLRMYGVLPLTISDPSNELSPIVKAPDKIKPKSDYQIEVSEKDGKEMYYTLAVVDEGLLNLTRFITPQPGKHFYAKQSLGVKTWDLYDLVAHGYGDRIERFISIGGDGEIGGDPGDRKANRFKPVVSFLGPFHLPKGKSKRHKLSMENYMGEVRAMVVARNKHAYGSSSESIPVSNPVMVLPTFPRVVSPNSSISLPISVFSTEENIRNVTVVVDLGPGLSSNEPSNKRITFNKIGDQMVTFAIEAGDYTGPSYARVVAKYDGNSIDQRIDFVIENANPVTHEVVDLTIQPDEQKTFEYLPYGISGTSSGLLEISTFPAINLEERLDYLIRYPYGCVEQTTSSVFPQLYLADIIDLSTDDSDKAKRNIQKGIERLISFQMGNGALSYWRGGREVSEWGTSYAGHFMLMAREKGYYIPDYFWSRWLKYQKEEATYYRDRGNQRAGLMQAYRLYTLARYGEPEWGAMNFLRNEELSTTATYILASAYAAASKNDIASAIIAGKKIQVEDYQEMSYTYGSTLRDKALIAEAMMSNGINDNVRSLIREVAMDLGENRWYNTQATSFALTAVGKYLSQVNVGELKADLTLPDGSQVNIESDRALFQYTFSIPESRGSYKMVNKSEGELYVRLIKSGKLPYGTSSDKSSNLKLNVNYRDLDGKSIDITSLEQGKDFVVELTATNPGTRNQDLEEMALTYVIPSGWEIVNDRISGNISGLKSDTYNHMDIRDDRVNYFFDLRGTKTFRLRLTATYAGRYYQPDTYCTAMYDQKVSAVRSGQWIEVKLKEDVQ